MDDITRRLSMGAAAAGEKIYIEDVFSTWLYTGNGSTQTITNGIDLAGEGGMVWLKSRSAAENHFTVFDDSGTLKSVRPNQTSIAGTASWHTWNSNGFNLLTATNNTNEVTYASWTFRKAAKFFDVVTYVGDNSDNRQISHSLGSVPGAVIVKSISDTGNWGVWHRSLSSTDVNMFLNLNVAAASQSNFSLDGSASFTSSTFPVSYAGAGGLNTSGQTYVAYLFAHDAAGFGDSGNESVIKCGSYTGNGSASGQAIDLGWEPQWIMIKSSSVASNWQIIDTMRGATVTSGGTRPLRADLNNEEYQGDLGYPYATGFVAGPSTNTNNNGSTFIYIAIRRGPMRTPTDASKVFSSLAITTSVQTTGTVRTTGFPVDMMLSTARTITLDKYISTKLLGGFPSSDVSCPNLRTSSTGAESSNPSMAYDAWNTTIKDGSFYGVDSIRYFFRRAPGFFDVLAYTGTGSARTVSHNLGVATELMIVKTRGGGSWHVYSTATGSTKYLNLQDTAGSLTDAAMWNSTTPTSSSFSLGIYGVNESAINYIAYLFASYPGVSKVGSYTGTGTTLSVDCGFTAGARFVLIKRTDSTGDWYVWDTSRGIVSGNDPYLLLNSTAAEVTNTDYIDPLNSGFQISSTAPDAINANGGTFIFLAIA